MPHWLSVDFDFFIPEEFDWDFGHSEAHAPELQNFLWIHRVASMAACQGKDLVGLTTFRPEALPTDFWSTLAQSGYDLQGAKVAVAESHKEAGPWFLSAMNEDMAFNPTIVDIDAHHDLGYCSKAEFKKLVKEARVDAGSWLGVLLHLCPELETELVFPQWEPTAIADTKSQAPLERKVWSRVRMATWPTLSTPTEPIERVFVCRSGPWSPPWHDVAFEAFVQELEQITGSVADVAGASILQRPWVKAPIISGLVLLRYDVGPLSEEDLPLTESLVSTLLALDVDRFGDYVDIDELRTDLVKVLNDNQVKYHSFVITEDCSCRWDSSNITQNMVDQTSRHPPKTVADHLNDNGDL